MYYQLKFAFLVWLQLPSIDVNLKTTLVNLDHIEKMGKCALVFIFFCDEIDTCHLVPLGLLGGYLVHICMPLLFPQ